MMERTNEEWVYDLSQGGRQQEEALIDLRDFLLRAVLVYLGQQRSDLTHLEMGEIRQMAEDVTQDALLAVQQNLDTFRYESKFTTWAYRFVINRAISVLRRRRRTAPSIDELREQKSSALMRILEEEGVDARLLAQRRNIILLVRQIIDTELTELQRMALLAVYFDDFTIAEVAGELEMTPNALYKLLHDARKKIKRQLQGHRLSAGDILALFEDDW
jgi:RNA polymerase sigma-70 factor (ECF subfamily)